MSADFKDELIATLPAVRGFARTFERDRARADDLMQETMVRAWANRDGFRDGTNMKAWLFTILRNVYRSQYRKMKPEVEDVDGEYSETISVEGGQEGHIACTELREALTLLPPDQREAVIMIGATGLSYDEAAEIVGAPVGTLKARVSRGRARLAELLGEDRPASRGAAPAEAAANA